MRTIFPPDRLAAIAHFSAARRVPTPRPTSVEDICRSDLDIGRPRQ